MFETSLTNFQPTWRHIPNDSKLKYKFGNIISIQIPTDTQPEIYLLCILVKYPFSHVNLRVYGGRKIKIPPKRPLPSTKPHGICVISGFHREEEENCALLGYYAVSIATCLPTFRVKISVPPFGGLESDMGNSVLLGFKSLNIY